MKFSSGTQLGAYEILAPLGAGGMGEVYKARDPRLNRVLAIKVLPEAAADNTERRERFEREARTIAALNHPNIVTIFSVEHDPLSFLTMELVEGRTLAEAIPAGGLPLGRLLDIAIAVIEAVSAAHQKGITHRDLKPANIMLGEGEHQGRIKVLDFGLAKLTGPPSGADSGTDVPTALATGEGRILGTVAYMSPEQAEGRAIDARSDLFSFGVILYEMATGRRPFVGDTSISIISSIVKDTPAPVNDVNRALPRELGRIIRRALSKDPERRYQSAKDIRNDLEELKASLDSGALAAESTTVAEGRARPQARSWAWAALAIGVVATIVTVTMMRRDEPPAPAASSMPLQITRLTSSGDVRSPAISPDGKFVAYVQGVNEQTVWVHQIDGNSRTRIVDAVPGTFIHGLTVTPDGAFVDFVRQPGTRAPEIWRVPFLGGVPRKLVDEVWSAPGWSPDGTQMAFVANSGEALVVADADGGRPRVIATRNAPRRYLGFSYVLRPEPRPVWLPDGQSIAVIGNDDTRGYTALQIVSVNVTTGVETALSLPASPDLTPGVGMALSRDGKSFLLTRVMEGGQAQVVSVRATDGQITRLTNDVNQYAGLSAAGDTAVTAHHAIQSSLWIADAAGGNARQIDRDVPAELARSGVAWATKGRVIYFASLASGTGLWSTDLVKQTTQLIVPGGVTPATSADGQTLVFMKAKGTLTLWQSDADGRHAVEIPKAIGYAPSLLPDGSGMFYISGGTVSQKPWFADLRGSVDPREFSTTAVTMYGIAASPDGKYVMLSAGITDGRRDIEIVPVRGGEPVHRLSVPGAIRGQWTPDGRSVAYLTADDRSNIWVQPLAGGAPHKLSQFADRRIVAYAWSPDGKQLAISRATDTSDIVLLKGVR